MKVTNKQAKCAQAIEAALNDQENAQFEGHSLVEAVQRVKKVLHETYVQNNLQPNEKPLGSPDEVLWWACPEQAQKMVE